MVTLTPAQAPLTTAACTALLSFSLHPQDDIQDRIGEPLVGECRLIGQIGEIRNGLLRLSGPAEEVRAEMHRQIDTVFNDMCAAGLIN